MNNKENNRWEDSLKSVPVDINKVEFVNKPAEEKKYKKADADSIVALGRTAGEITLLKGLIQRIDEEGFLISEGDCGVYELVSPKRVVSEEDGYITVDKNWIEANRTTDALVEEWKRIIVSDLLNSTVDFLQLTEESAIKMLEEMQARQNEQEKMLRVFAKESDGE